jgi:hypothetical protein
MTLKKGAAVPIRIDDPSQLLSQHEGKTPGAHLLLGVGNDAFAFRPVSILAQDANGRDHQIIVPFNLPVKLVVHSSFFQLSDATGIPLSRTGAAIPVLVPSGTQPTIIKLKVTGGRGSPVVRVGIEAGPSFAIIGGLLIVAALGAAQQIVVVPSVIQFTANADSPVVTVAQGSQRFRIQFSILAKTFDFMAVLAF